MDKKEKDKLRRKIDAKMTQIEYMLDDVPVAPDDGDEYDAADSCHDNLEMAASFLSEAKEDLRKID